LRSPWATTAVLHWLDPGDQESDRAVPPLFVLHATSGTVALLAGSLQLRLATRVLGSRRSIHRRLGRTYLWAAWTTNLSSLGVAAFFDVSLAAKTAFAGVSLLWFGTTTVAFLRIRHGKVRQRREWWIRRTRCSQHRNLRAGLDPSTRAQLTAARPDWRC
jgi:uncharacterized membrane protein